MPTLLVRLKDGTIYRSEVPLHCMIHDYREFKDEDVEAVGFVTKGREVWTERLPH